MPALQGYPKGTHLSRRSLPAFSCAFIKSRGSPANKRQVHMRRSKQSAFVLTLTNGFEIVVYGATFTRAIKAANISRAQVKSWVQHYRVG